MIPSISLTQSSSQAWRDACQSSGFFYLFDHGLDAQLINNAIAVSHQFFAQEEAVKNQIRRTESNCWGYYDAELTKNQQDWKEILDIGADMHTGPLAGARTQLPKMEGFEPVISQLTDVLHHTALAVTSKVLSSLDITLDLRPIFGEHSSFLRINHYPICEDPAPADAESGTSANFGIHHHTDAGAVTILCQEDVTSLQVLQQGIWQTIPSARDALIVNLGDIIQVWSNDLYTAPVHRVLARSDQRRISIPYFLNPSYSYTYQPLVEGAPRYKPISWAEFRAGRTAGDYADQGAEVQISDFKV